MYLNAPADGEITLKIFDLRGGLIRNLLDKVKGAASRFLLWDGRGEGGWLIPDGVYVIYCAYISGNGHAEKKIPIVLGGPCLAP
jgi:hypothetical protein